MSAIRMEKSGPRPMLLYWLIMFSKKIIYISIIRFIIVMWPPWSMRMINVVELVLQEILVSIISKHFHGGFIELIIQLINCQ